MIPTTFGRTTPAFASSIIVTLRRIVKVKMRPMSRSSALNQKNGLKYCFMAVDVICGMPVRRSATKLQISHGCAIRARSATGVSFRPRPINRRSTTRMAPLKTTRDRRCMTLTIGAGQVLARMY